MYFQPVAGTRVSRVQFSNSSKNWELLCANHLFAPSTFFCWYFQCKRVCVNQQKIKNQQWMLVSIQLIWCIFIMTHLSKRTPIMTPTDGEPKENWSGYYQDMQSRSKRKLSVLPHRVSHVTNWRNAQINCYPVQSIIFVITWGCYLIPQRRPILGTNLESTVIFFPAWRSATIVYFISKPSC